MRKARLKRGSASEVDNDFRHDSWRSWAVPIPEETPSCALLIINLSYPPTPDPPQAKCPPSASLRLLHFQ